MVRFVQFSYYKTANCTASCGVMRYSALLFAVQYGYAIMPFYRRFWYGFYSLCGLVNTPKERN